MKKQQLTDSINVKKVGSGTYLWTYRTPAGRDTYEHTNHNSKAFDDFNDGILSVDELKGIVDSIKYWGIKI